MSNIRRLFSIRAVVAASATSLLVLGGTGLTLQEAQAGNGHRPGCPKHLNKRTAEETIRQHLALLQSGQIDLAMCDYDANAEVVLPGQVVTGLDNIKAGLSGVGALLGGAIPQIQTLTATDSAVMITFTAFGTPCTIPDGSDTYIVDKGQIVTQTVHDTFHNAEGQTCPVAAPGS